MREAIGELLSPPSNRPRQPRAKSKPQPKSQPQPKPGRPSVPQSSAAQVFAAMVKSSPAKPTKTVMQRLCRDLWDCRIFHASAIHKHVSVEPCAVFAKDDQEAREVKDWISANKSDAPIALVTLDTHGLTKVLVEPGPTVANVRLEHFGDESKAPKPKAGTPDAKFNDSPIQSKDVDETLTFRLTLSREFSEASLFDKGKSKPQLLPSLLLPSNALSQVIRTFGLAVYDNEVTCLILIKKDSGENFSMQITCRGFYYPSPQQEAKDFVVTATLQRKCQ